MGLIDDNDINDCDDIFGKKGSGFQLSNDLVSAVIAAELAVEILGATPCGNIDSIDNDINTSNIGIVASAEGQYDNSLEGILADLGYTIDNLGDQDEEALGDPMDKSEEASEENETATLVNNTPVATNDNGDTDSVDDALVNGDDNPISGQVSLFADSDDMNDTDNDDGSMDGQISFFDDDFSANDDSTNDGDGGDDGGDDGGSDGGSDGGDDGGSDGGDDGGDDGGSDGGDDGGSDGGDDG